MATLEIIEKSVSSIKKSNAINVENEEFEEVVNDIIEVMVVFKDQIIKKRTMFNQEQWPKKPIVNLITDTITKSEVCIIELFYFLNISLLYTYRYNISI